MQRAQPQAFSRVLSSMCTEPHPDARAAATRFLGSNPGDPGTYETVATLEEDVVEILGEMAGIAGQAHGYVTSGGTEANIQAVRIARAQATTREPNMVVPESGHFSFWKAAELLDVELRVAPLDGYRVSLDAVEAMADSSTIMVAGVAGSTEYGRVDDIPALAAIAGEVGALTHIDAAWGGFCLPFTDHDWSFADAPIDTMTIDPHKMGRAVVPAGGLITDRASLLDALAIDTPYLESTSQITLTGTRSGAGVAGAAAVMETLWVDGYRDQYETCLENAEWLAEALADRDIDHVAPDLPLVAVALEPTTFEGLREQGWRLSRTETGETRIVVMPHVTRTMLEAMLSELDELV